MSLADLEVIEINVKIKDNKVIEARSSGNKLRSFEKTFTGKNANSFYEILPKVLATCGQSHLYAYTSRVSDNERVIKTLVMLEIIDSHLRHPYAYWFPHVVNDERYSFPHGEKFQKVAKISQRIKWVMEYIGGKWPHVDYLRNTKVVKFSKELLKDIREFFEKEVIGMNVEDFLQLNEIEEFKGDLKVLIEHSLDSLYWNFGLRNYITVGFPFVSTADLLLIEDKGLEIFYKGSKVEVGPLAQALTFDKLIKKYHEKYGPSPLLRELSRIKIVAKLLNEFEDFETVSKPFSIEDGYYISSVESIRGSLIHSFSISHGLIESYRIIQPTSIIASPRGAIEASLIGLKVADPKNAVEVALTVSSLDTCFVSIVKIFEDEKLRSIKRIGGFC
ncbi:hydrogenase [Sulfolobus sp. SCGC AB-777_L09]|nr:hydrogenase [Sulfolobus sp. SCGC AB-777_L09]